MKKIDLLAVAILAAALLGGASACQKNEANTKVNAAVNGASNTNQNTASTPAAANSAPISADSPTAAYKAAYAARKNKDIPALKKLMSKEILQFFEDIGALGDKKMTVDELLKELAEKPQAASDDVRNEKINGDKATIEYLDEDNKWQPMEFVREDGMWKLTFEPEAGPGEPDDSNKKGKK